MKSSRRLGLFVCALAVTACASGGGGGGENGAGSGGGGDEWKLLGQRAVNFQAERDVIPVTAARGVWKKIQLRIKKRGVVIQDLKVHFGNGDVHDVSLRTFIPKGGKTRVIDLPGKARVIKKVSMVYKSRGKGKGKAVVRVWGRR
jgi:hypothetical protein